MISSSIFVYSSFSPLKSNLCTMKFTNIETTWILTSAKLSEAQLPLKILNLAVTSKTLMPGCHSPTLYR